jgi:dTDP-glucose 4,6-dehydratase
VGFIGANFVNRYANEHEITVLDLLTYAANLDNLIAVKDKIGIGVIDCRSYQSHDDYFDAIVHFAAESSVDVSIKDPCTVADTNYMGTLNMLEQARKHDLRFLQISTDEVYGDTNGKRPSKETDTLNPSSPYSASKAAADMLVMAYVRTYGLKASITRTCNNYGRFQHQEKLIPKFICSALKNEPLTVHGRGNSLREWIHVDDNCLGIMTVLKKGEYMNGKTIGSGIYNIGTNERYSVMEVADMIRAETESKSKITHVEGRRGEDKAYRLDSSKMRLLGWKPEVPFSYGLKKTVEWYE